MAWEVSSDAGHAGKNTDDSGAISDAPGLPASLVPVPPTPAPAPPILNLPPVPGPTKVQVVVRDVAYVTYKAFLYYVSRPGIVHSIDTYNTVPLAVYRYNSPLLTRNLADIIHIDTIVFAPLKSQFMLSSPATSTFAQAITHLPISSDGAPMHSPGIGIMRAGTNSAEGGRRGWVRDWEAHNPERPSPCSAKAIYRLADSKSYRTPEFGLRY